MGILPVRTPGARQLVVHTGNLFLFASVICRERDLGSAGAVDAHVLVLNTSRDVMRAPM
jgi:hypothetical protein